MLKKILIANRGEIAVRIIRACREMGIKSAAIYSEADKTSKHILLADESYHIGAAPSSESYLNIEKIINIAKKINADAIHPGYGFLSENAGFAKAVEDANLIFIGPSSESISLMGSKTGARKLMIKNNVPVVPGTDSTISSLEEGIKKAEEIGFPVLLKASAGGGGKGMRKVSSADEFEAAFNSAKSESLKAFGNDEIYIEKYILNPRHIEVQILSDKYGNYLHLFERECSIQRRHQKIVEEAPSPFVDEETRIKITEAAVKAAKSCNYLNAGTIEILMDKNKNFYFLEMNTRLQVEHPVTELITGVDLVKEQIRIAAGEKISFKQEDLKIKGHAIESRIYAEDPSGNFLPSTGTLIQYNEPAGPGVRVDSGFGKDSEISIYYDPLIAKLICYGKTREEAVSITLRALSEFKISGINDNISFLKFIMNYDDFKKGKLNINLVEEKIIPAFNEFEIDEDILEAASAAAALLKNRQKVIINQNGSGNKWIHQNYE